MLDFVIYFYVIIVNLLYDIVYDVRYLELICYVGYEIISVLEDED